MGIKKRLCNAPAEQVASHGDYELCGMFIGAGRASSVIEDLDLRLWFEGRVVGIEQRYIQARKALAQEYLDAMHSVYDKLLEKLEYKGPSGGGAD